MSPVNVNTIGTYIREQREQAKISLRQLAQAAGVSNPYLSQIERGLRRPSADILQQIAKGLRVSAEALYVQAGFLEDRPGHEVRDAVLADPELTERQKQMLIEIYESFRKEAAVRTAAHGEVDHPADPARAATEPDEAALAWPEEPTGMIATPEARAGAGAEPTPGAMQEPASGAGQEPASGAGQEPASGAGQEPTSGAGQEPTLGGDAEDAATADPGASAGRTAPERNDPSVRELRPHRIA
jgi:transcriptional regulator with XRE-family HTH domain